MTRVNASAPGKALLCGEYAVLHGAPAVVAAVDRRVTVSWSDDVVEMPLEVQETLKIACARAGAVAGRLIADPSALRQGEVKLGLGSSAAAAAATAGAVFATNGFDLGTPSVEEQVLECALRGHAAVAPQGSGVDVAASTLGGFLRFTRGEAGPDTQRLSAPEGLCIELVWTGHAARTSDLVARVYALERSDPALHRARIDELEALALAFAEAFSGLDAADVVNAGAAYGAAMAALGVAAGAPIVEARLARVMELSSRFSGGAKPCGAGGGDVAVAFFVDPAAAGAFKLACKDEGLHPIDVSWGAPGVRAH